MTQPPFLDADDLGRLLSMDQAIDALDEAFGGRLPEAPARSHLDVGSGDLLLMPAWSADAAGVKLVSVAPGNPQLGLPLIHGVYMLFDKPTLQPVALFDAAPLTALRTAAVSGVATRHLARHGVSNLVLFGAGTQARSHLEAMAAVRPIQVVTVVSRTETRAGELAAQAREMGFDARSGTPHAVVEADLVCTCTTSSDPVFEGALLKQGTHVNAVGSYKPEARELDDGAMRRASITVDVDIAARESGDLAIPLKTGMIAENEISLLADVVAGKRIASDSEITVFKSVGAAFEDLVVAEAAARRL